MPPPYGRGALSDTVIPLSVRLSVCPMAELSSYSHRVTAGHQRCADCEPVRGQTQICRDFCHHRTAIGGSILCRRPRGDPCSRRNRAAFGVRIFLVG